MKIRYDIRWMVYCAMLTALTVVLSRFASFYIIPPNGLRMSFEGIPIVVAAVWLGPLGGLIVGGLSDVIGALLFPVGAYFPAFTVTPLLFGLITGVMMIYVFKGERKLWQFAVGILTAELLANVLWGSFAVKLYFDMLGTSDLGYLAWVAARLPGRAILYAVNTLLSFALVKTIDRIATLKAV